MGPAQRLWLVCILAAVAARGVIGCAGYSLDSCHQRMIEELGCCPLCDAECREQAIGGCETEVHERPLELEESAATETSSGSGAPSSPSFD